MILAEWYPAGNIYTLYFINFGIAALYHSTSKIIYEVWDLMSCRPLY